MGSEDKGGQAEVGRFVFHKYKMNHKTLMVGKKDLRPGSHKGRKKDYIKTAVTESEPVALLRTRREIEKTEPPARIYRQLLYSR